MIDRTRLAIVGSGPTALYVLKHMAAAAKFLRGTFRQITLFEQDWQLGTGMPYSPRTTDHHNICNISSKELPPLEISFAQWLHSLDDPALERFGVVRSQISEDETYSRLAMGQYFADQMQRLVLRLKRAGFQVVQRARCRVVDIRPAVDQRWLDVVTDTGESQRFETVVIASGHRFPENDRPEAGYFGSPWPIQKLLPANGQRFNFAIGTLGASLSAFDVISSLAHRHGTFRQTDRLRYFPDAGCEELKFVMHAINGWLPHLQYEQREPFRELYRHVTQAELQQLRDAAGFMHLDTYFNAVCRPALKSAFAKDARGEIVDLLCDSDFGIEEFVARLTAEHEYADAFEGMRSEMPEARESVEADCPIHWKEVVDDLMFTLNFHAEWMPAEDHIRFNQLIMPFLLNVIAALPLRSAQMLLALHEAGRLELVEGTAEVVSRQEGLTSVAVRRDSSVERHSYQMFVDCSGQAGLEMDQFPFPTLVESGSVRPARARFARDNPSTSLPGLQRQRLDCQAGSLVYRIGGIDVDSRYRVTGTDGLPNPRLYDLAFPHTTGIRPYSYGLQACELTARMTVASWTGQRIH